MAYINDKATVEFIVNNSQAKQKLEEVNRLLLTARDNLNAATASGDTKGINKYTKEIIKLEQEQRKMESRTQTIRRALENMDKAKPKELRQTIKEINAELNSGAVERNSKEWKDLQEKLRQCKAELKGIQEEGKLAKRGIDWELPAEECWPISKLNCGQSIYGGGFLISERLAAERLAAERLAAERLAAERLAARECFTYELDNSEREIIASLGGAKKK